MTGVAPPVTDARKVLLDGLIDDAAMFPPALTDLPEAVAAHRAAQAAGTAWVVGRLLVPAARVPELAAATAAEPVGRVGVVLAPADAPDRAAVVRTLERVVAERGGLDVDAVELRAPVGLSAADVAAIAEAAAPLDARLSYELDPREPGRFAAALDAVAGADRDVGVKLRCGGVRAEDVPSDAVVADLLAWARARDVPTKMTQGLHQPFRTVDRDTGALQHGFVNLVAAVALTDADPAAVVAEPVAGAFTLDEQGLGWRGHRADPAGVAAARRILTALGSCSLDEPLEALREHGALPEQAVRP